MASKRSDLREALAQEMPQYVSAAVRFQIAVADQLGMPLTDVHAIGALLELGPSGARQLADLMGLTTGAVTRLLDRLERAGYVRREPDPTDRRRILVHVVPERLDDIAEYYRSMDDRWRKQVAQYSDDQLEFLVDFLRQGRDHANAETRTLRTEGRPHATRRRPAP
ncbi:DNA-binding MarR family transcriptional regulator [Kribbella amoyensis]|uniref:DNA-binding MarR family transcriptional regulator n=1 Tax=Kribbella amoyensis TaxID=996641 RepID=A0A561B968_9ACTN|nr:MarR family transcriptional regulator [Kribbella amoyensis]TWD75403.1 DNA-binding MarR family transcriptional regulator [Kribbella amoyensis]